MAKQTDNQVSAVRRAKHGWILTLFFSILAVFYLYPIFLVLINSLKKKGFIMKSPFALPDERSFFGMTNFVMGIEKTNFFAAFGNSVIITVGSVAVIIFCTSMCAWFITRVHNKFTMALYMLCLFSMIVPFQMVMFTLSKIADMLKLKDFYIAKRITEEFLLSDDLLERTLAEFRRTQPFIAILNRAIRYAHEEMQ